MGRNENGYKHKKKTTKKEINYFNITRNEETNPPILSQTFNSFF